MWPKQCRRSPIVAALVAAHVATLVAALMAELFLRKPRKWVLPGPIGCEKRGPLSGAKPNGRASSARQVKPLVAPSNSTSHLWGTTGVEPPSTQGQIEHIQQHPSQKQKTRNAQHPKPARVKNKRLNRLTR